MAVKKRKLGKVKKQVNGYLIRFIGTFKTLNNSCFQHDGTYGVYTTKKLVKKGFKSISDAIAYAEKL